MSHLDHLERLIAAALSAARDEAHEAASIYSTAEEREQAHQAWETATVALWYEFYRLKNLGPEGVRPASPNPYRNPGEAITERKAEK